MTRKHVSWDDPGGVTACMCVQLGTKFGIHLTLEQWYRQYGPIYKFFLGKTPVVVVTGILHSLQLCATLKSMIVPMLLQILTYRRKDTFGLHAWECMRMCNGTFVIHTIQA